MSDPIGLLLDALENDSSLAEPAHWRARSDALDRIDLHLPGLASGARDAFHTTEKALRSRAAALVARFDAVDAIFFEDMRQAIRDGHGADALQRCRREARTARTNGVARGDAYDALDTLLAGILRFDAADVPDDDLADDMVFYQPTPARHLFDLLDRAALTRDDTLVDLGSGLGHVPLLAAICTPAQGIGIELQPGHVDCARRSAAMLRLERVMFVQEDARVADLSTGTVFYLYTPFSGAILRTVLDALRREATRRAIRLCTFGPCTATVAKEFWLQPEEAVQAGRVAVFRARPVSATPADTTHRRSGDR